MLKTLKDIDNKTSAGLLARTALHIKNDKNVFKRPLIENEEELRDRLFEEICQILDITEENWDDNKSNHVTDYIDSEIERLLPLKENKNEIYKRMSSNGTLPSDLYTIHVIKNIKDFYGVKNYKKEEPLIKATVQNPDNEQHFKETKDPNVPSMVSLFTKHFKTKYPRNDFTLLVVGQRDGLVLNVHQVWRIYHDTIDTNDILSLVELLKRFSDKFGVEMEIEGEKKKFYLLGPLDYNGKVHIKFNVEKIKGTPQKFFTFSHFTEHGLSGDIQKTSLLVAIDLNKYKQVLKSRKLYD